MNTLITSRWFARNLLLHIKNHKDGAGIGSVLVRWEDGSATSERYDPLGSGSVEIYANRGKALSATTIDEAQDYTRSLVNNYFNEKRRRGGRGFGLLAGHAC